MFYTHHGHARVPHTYVPHTHTQTNLSADVICGDVARSINADYDDCKQDLARPKLIKNYFLLNNSIVKDYGCVCGVLLRGGEDFCHSMN